MLTENNITIGGHKMIPIYKGFVVGADVGVEEIYLQGGTIAVGEWVYGDPILTISDDRDNVPNKVQIRCRYTGKIHNVLMSSLCMSSDKCDRDDYNIYEGDILLNYRSYELLLVNRKDGNWVLRDLYTNEYVPFSTYPFANTTIISSVFKKPKEIKVDPTKLYKAICDEINGKIATYDCKGVAKKIVYSMMKDK